MRFFSTDKVEKYRKGRILKGVVTGIESYGVFVQFDSYSGLIHIINTKIIDVDEELGHLKLSIKNIPYKEKRKTKRRKIHETPLGCKTLFYKLPIWIENNLKNHDKVMQELQK